MQEIWKAIEGFDGLYEVSNLGRVRKTTNGHIMRPVMLNRGYLIHRFCYKGKTYHRLLHRLIAQAFIPNPNNYPVINHINEIKTDNRIENLEWCTSTYNITTYYNNKRDKEAIELRRQQEKRQKEIDAIYGKNPTPESIMYTGLYLSLYRMINNLHKR